MRHGRRSYHEQKRWKQQWRASTRHLRRAFNFRWWMAEHHPTWTIDFQDHCATRKWVVAKNGLDEEGFNSQDDAFWWARDQAARTEGTLICRDKEGNDERFFDWREARWP